MEAWQQQDFDKFVGVDAGSLFVLEQGLPLDMAVGDFDSVTSEDLERIQAKATVFVQSPAEKNDTDLELALKEIFQRFPAAQVTVFGALGGRMDHALSNLFLASEPELAPYMRQICLQDRLNQIYFYPAGQHCLSPIEGMTYISFLPSDGSRLEIVDARYPLSADNYFFKKCYSSNEFIGKDIHVSLDTGYVLAIYSRDRS